MLGGAEINDFKLGRALQKQGHDVSYFFIHDTDKELSHNAVVLDNAYPVDMRYWLHWAYRAPGILGKVLRHQFEEIFLSKLLDQHKKAMTEQDLILITGRPLLAKLQRYIPAVVVRSERGVSNPRYRRMFFESRGVLFWGGCEEGHWAVSLEGVNKLALKPAVDDENFYPGMASPEIRNIMSGGLERPVITYTGRLDPIHQVDRIVEAAIDLAGAGCDFSLNIIGSGYMEKAVNDLAQQRLPEGHYHFHGRLASPDVAERLRATDIFIINPRQTNHPIAMMEAAACGVYVIAPDLGRAPEILENAGGFGELFRPNDLDDMKRVLQGAIKGKAYLQKPGERAPQFANWDDNAERLLVWYAHELKPGAERETAACPGFSAQRISEQAARKNAAQKGAWAGKSHAGNTQDEDATGPDVIYMCHQIVDLHFPEHYGEVYTRILPGRGFSGRIIAFVQDRESEIAQNLSSKGAVLLPRRPVGGVFARLWQYLVLLFRLLKLFFNNRDWKQARFFVAHNDPLLGFFAWARARLNGGAFVYRITHLMAEEALQDTCRERRVAAWIYKAARNWLIGRADAVLPMSRTMGRELCAQTGVPFSRMYPVVSAMDISAKPDRAQLDRAGAFKEDILQQLSAAGCRHWLVYVGTVNPFRELDFLIDVLAAVRARGLDTGLLLLGKTNRWAGTLEKIRDYARAQNVESRVVIADSVPSWALPKVLETCDVGLSPFPPNPVLRCNSPLKTLEYIRAGLPVVASAIPDHEDYVEQAGAGFVVAHKPETFADAVAGLLAEEGRVHTKRSREMRSWLAENRSLSNAADVFEAVFNSLDARRREAG